MAELSLQHLEKVYDNKVQAVFDFNLDVKDGEFIVLVGPSGCGKSTTLYMISGLQKPTSGKIFFGDDDVTELSTENRGIGIFSENICRE